MSTVSGPRVNYDTFQSIHEILVVMLLLDFFVDILALEKLLLWVLEQVELVRELAVLIYLRLSVNFVVKLKPF